MNRRHLEQARTQNTQIYNVITYFSLLLWFERTGIIMKRGGLDYSGRAVLVVGTFSTIVQEGS